jgi:hypothetical protein
VGEAVGDVLLLVEYFAILSRELTAIVEQSAESLAVESSQGCVLNPHKLANLFDRLVSKWHFCDLEPSAPECGVTCPLEQLAALEQLWANWQKSTDDVHLMLLSSMCCCFSVLL